MPYNCRVDLTIKNKIGRNVKAIIPDKLMTELKGKIYNDNRITNRLHIF